MVYYITQQVGDLQEALSPDGIIQVLSSTFDNNLKITLIQSTNKNNHFYSELCCYIEAIKINTFWE